MEMLKTKLVAFFKWKLDGARFYIGRSMTEVHKNLGISDEIFDSACQVFITSLKKFNPTQDVFDTFVGRISGLRHEICFPPVKNNNDGEQEENSEGYVSSDQGISGSLFNKLGDEVGIRNIVDSMIEQVHLNNLDLFKQGE